MNIRLLIWSLQYSIRQTLRKSAASAIFVSQVLAMLLCIAAICSAIWIIGESHRQNSARVYAECKAQGGDDLTCNAFADEPHWWDRTNKAGD